MDILEFAEQVTKRVREKLGDRYRVEVHEVRKNNNVKLTGMVILPECLNISPTIYLDSFHEAYENGTEMDTIVESLLHLYESGLPEKEIDMSFFQDFEQVKDRICYRLIHFERNKEYLESVPYIPFLDLAIVFYYAYEGKQIGKGTIAVCNNHLNMWKVGVTQIYEAAKENTVGLYPQELLPMTDVLTMLLNDMEEDTSELSERLDPEELLQAVPMQVLSNKERFFGAACMLYPNVLEQIAGDNKEGFFILPSSIHEGATC